jgi:hypothetical protein
MHQYKTDIASTLPRFRLPALDLVLELFFKAILAGFVSSAVLMAVTMSFVAAY